MAESSSVPDTLGGGRYEVGSPLGEGGMAAVFRVRDTLLGADRAVKLLSAELSQSKIARERFASEAKTMVKLAHPNILQVLDVGEDEGRPWFVMERVDGGHAMEWLGQHRESADLEALRITFELLQALAAAHHQGVLHRDVKPDNVLVTVDGSAKLSDFGIAKDPAQIRRTRTGMTMGTFGYMAPEQRDDAKHVSPRADLFSAGATLMALVTCAHPPELFASDLDPMALAPLPAPVADVVRKATRYKADERYASAREMARDVALARDQLAALRGLPPESSRWMARFDALLEARESASREEKLSVATYGMEEGTPTPAATLRDRTAQPQTVPAPASESGSSGRLVVAGMLAAVAAAVLFAGVLWWFALSGDPANCVGTWTGEGITLELGHGGAARVQGTVEVPGLAGRVRQASVRGRCPRPGGTLLLVEEGALDAGSWSVTVQGDRMEGAWTPQGGVSKTVSLTRAAP